MIPYQHSVGLTSKHGFVLHKRLPRLPQQVTGHTASIQQHAQHSDSPLSLPQRLFDCAGAAGRPLTLNISNAGACSYPSAWSGYKAAATYDLQHWFRVQDTTYDEATGVLTIKHKPDHNCVRYAYFAHYSLERHAALIMQMQVSHADLDLRGASPPVQRLRMVFNNKVSQ